jgi:hypothetical protein
MENEFGCPTKASEPYPTPTPYFSPNCLVQFRHNENPYWGISTDLADTVKGRFGYSSIIVDLNSEMNVQSSLLIWRYMRK